MSKKIFFIAGESSGDVLGARLINAMTKQDSAVSFDGIGGPQMQAQGLQSRMPMQDLCVMGLVEIVRQLPRLLRLIESVACMVEEAQPDVLVTIDLPDFNFRVARKLRQRGLFKGKIVHYVAPTVWAWRPGRAKKIAKLMDGLICLFPMEPPYFERHGLKTVFVGHSMVEDDVPESARGTFRAQHAWRYHERVLGLFPGSRESELRGAGAVILQAARRVLDVNPGVKLVVPTVPHMRESVCAMLRSFALEAVVVDDPSEKVGAFRACDAALAVSGTVGLELAFAGVPHAIAYKAHKLTGFLLRHLVKVKYAHLANILLDQPMVEEFLQDRCDPVLLAQAAHNLLNMDDAKRESLKKDFESLVRCMQPKGGVLPSSAAATFVLSFIR